MSLEDLNYENWRYVAKDAGALELIPGWDWPILARSTRIERLGRDGISLSRLSELIAESFLDVLQRLRPRRDRTFLEIGADEAILARPFQRYLNRDGCYLLLHPDPEIVDWVNEKLGYADPRIRAFCLEELGDGVLAEKEGHPDCVLDRGQFCGGFVTPTQRQIAELICDVAAKGGAKITSLAPLVEFIPDERPKTAKWSDIVVSPMGRVRSCLLTVSGCEVQFLDQKQFVEAAAVCGFEVLEVSPPSRALNWDFNADTCCARVTYRSRSGASW